MKELNEWREAGKAIGVKLGVIQERERIIKLIPEYMQTVLECGHETASKQLIALIKGENK